MGKSVKKIVSFLALIILFGSLFLTACDRTEKEILIVSRELGSGTREAFDNLINGSGGNLAFTANGVARDGVHRSAIIQNSTGNVMTKVASVKSSIGYISLGSLNGSIKAIMVGEVKPTPENVLSGTYKLQRPFVIMTSKVPKSYAVTDFISYLKSAQAQIIVADNKFVVQESSFDYAPPTQIINGKVVIKGSSSVDPLMDNLIKDYRAKGGEKVANVEFAKDAQGSSQGVSSAKGDSTGSVIGMSSSAVKEADAPNLEYFTLALDAVVIIVNKANSIENLDIAQLYDIYTGKTRKYSALG